MSTALPNMAIASRNILQRVEWDLRILARFVKRVCQKSIARYRKRRLKDGLTLQEQIRLSDKRSLAIVACGEERFLIGCSPQSICLIAKLPPKRNFRDVLREQDESTGPE